MMKKRNFFPKGAFPRTSERLLEGNVDASLSSVVSSDVGGVQSRVRVIRQDDLADAGGSGGETRSLFPEPSRSRILYNFRFCSFTKRLLNIQSTLR